MGNPPRVQIAIQGGGAKIIGLVAAMEVLQKLEGDKKIEVTRLAGTSAGAIVAALYSAGVSMGELRVSMADGELKKLFQNYALPGWVEIAANLARGSPLFDPSPIRNFLRDLLKAHESERLRDLEPEVQIVSANIAASRKHLHAPDETILEALMSSTAIPFVFRVWDTRKNSQEAQEAVDRKDPLLVDGGICENLPIEDLLKQEHKLGPVVAVTFSTDKYQRPTNILGFAKAVMDTAIDNSVHRARSLLPASAILEIGKWFQISTLDFKEAIDAAGSLAKPGAPYLTVRDHALEFFERYIQRREDGNPSTSYDPWSSHNSTVRKIMDANWHVFETFRKSPMRFDHVSMVGTIFGNGEADQLALKCKFSVLDEPMAAFGITVMNTINLDYLGRTSWGIYDEKQKEVKTTTVPIRNPKQPDYRAVALYFDKPLPANSGPYELEITDFADVILDKLEKEKKDKWEFGSERSKGETAIVELVIVYPKKMKLKSEMIPEFADLDHELISSKQDKDRFRGNLPRDRFMVTGMRIKNVPQATVGIKILLNENDTGDT